MDTNALKLVIDVAKSGSFAEAARKTNRDPSQVSRIVAQLEQQLNFPLFKRSTRSLSLTEAGERYLHQVSNALEALKAAEDDARELNQSPSGLLRLTASTAFGQEVLLPHLSAFYQKYPDIELDLLLTDANIDLVRENVDLACRLSPTFESDLVGSKLFDTHYKVVASTAYLENHPAIHRPEDISQHQSVVFSLPQYRTRWHFKGDHAAVLDVPINSRITVSNALAVKECLVQGLGPGLVPDWLVEKEITKGNLRQILPQWRVTATDFNTGVWLLYPSRKYLPVKTRVMIDFLKTQLS